MQIDDTAPKKRLHTNDVIIEFYKKIGILTSEVPYIINLQSNSKDDCDKYYNELCENGFIEINREGVSYFNIKKFIELYGNKIINLDMADIVCQKIQSSYWLTMKMFLKILLEQLLEQILREKSILLIQY